MARLPRCGPRCRHVHVARGTACSAKTPPLRTVTRTLLQQDRATHFLLGRLVPEQRPKAASTHAQNITARTHEDPSARMMWRRAMRLRPTHVLRHPLRCPGGRDPPPPQVETTQLHRLMLGLRHVLLIHSIALRDRAGAQQRCLRPTVLHHHRSAASRRSLHISCKVCAKRHAASCTKIDVGAWCLMWYGNEQAREHCFLTTTTILGVHKLATRGAAQRGQLENERTCRVQRDAPFVSPRDAWAALWPARLRLGSWAGSATPRSASAAPPSVRLRPPRPWGVTSPSPEAM